MTNKTIEVGDEKFELVEVSSGGIINGKGGQWNFPLYALRPTTPLEASKLEWEVGSRVNELIVTLENATPTQMEALATAVEALMEAITEDHVGRYDILKTIVDNARATLQRSK